MERNTGEPSVHMSLPPQLMEKLQKLPLSEEAKRKLSTRISETYPKCMCRDCPSYYVCKSAVDTNEPVLYCNPMRGKSATITKEFGCLCSACPVYKMNHFTEDGGYCTRGPAKEMVAMIAMPTGRAEKALPKIEPEGSMYVNKEGNAVIVTIELPGVKQDNIKLQIHDTGFNLTARKDDVEFVDSHDFGCLVNPAAAKSEFKDGILEIIIPVKSGVPDKKKLKIRW